MNIAIAGAGLIGRMVGWRLVRPGYDVRIFERTARNQPQSSSHVAASMLAPLSEYPDCEQTIWDMAQSSMALWPSWLDELQVPYAIEGSIVVAHAQDAALLGKFKRTLSAAGLAGVRELSSVELTEFEPELAGRFSSGLLLEGEGWLDNRVLLETLEDCCGAIEYETAVEPHSLKADIVIDCRGMGADEKELRGVRGEAIRLYAPEVELRHPIRLMHPKYQLYVSPRDQHVYVVGATQIESNARSPMAVRSALELLSAAYAVHPGFAEADILELNVGVRPAYPDNLPRVQWHNGVLCVNGLYRHGYLVAPAISNCVANEVREACRYSLTASQ